MSISVKMKTDGSIRELSKLEPDELKEELEKYSKESLVKIALAGIWAADMYEDLYQEEKSKYDNNF